MKTIKLAIKGSISFFAFLFLVFSVTELDFDMIQEDAYEFYTLLIFLIGVFAGTILLWTREKFGAALLIFTIIIEFIIFMIVDGELVENLTFLIFILPPLILLRISTYEDEKKSEHDFE